MGQAAELVDLIAKQEPNTTATGETVVVTVPVTFARDPQHPGGTLRLNLTLEQAKHLAPDSAGDRDGRSKSKAGAIVMAKYTFKQFQAEYPNDAACLAKLMEINYGGTDITCPACGVER